MRTAELEIFEGPHDVNSTEETTTVSCNVYRSIIEVPAQEKLKDMLKDVKNMLLLSISIYLSLLEDRGLAVAETPTGVASGPHSCTCT